VYARRIGRGLHVALDGRRVTLVPVRHALAFPHGAAGLRTMRLEAIFRGPRVERPVSAAIRDTNYAGRLGWKEIVVGADTRSTSRELRVYPKSLLHSPLDVTAARATLVPSSAAPPTVTSGSALQAPDRVADTGFARLIARRHLSALVILGALAAAMFWGAAHALSPGHGKAIVTAYLVGERGTAKHAALLGLIVTATHTVGVFTLGLVTLALSQFVVPDRLYPWLNLVAGALVVSVGVAVLRVRVRDWRHARAHRRGAYDHDHEHDHHGHEHHHADDVVDHDDGSVIGRVGP
jgi:hypothetical protein